VHKPRSGVKIFNNSGNGVDICTNNLGAHPLAIPLATTSIIFKDLLIDGGRRGGILYNTINRMPAPGAQAAGVLLVEGGVLRNTLQAAVMLELTDAAKHHTTLRDVIIEGVASNYSGEATRSLAGSRSPILLGDPKYGGHIKGVIHSNYYIGGLSLQNVTVHDSFDRPWAAFVGGSGSLGAGDVTGAVTVHNMNGCRHALGNVTKGHAVLIDGPRSPGAIKFP
jgi:hypothetical protein